jgi:hypothetical protein
MTNGHGGQLPAFFGLGAVYVRGVCRYGIARHGLKLRLSDGRTVEPDRRLGLSEPGGHSRQGAATVLQPNEIEPHSFPGDRSPQCEGGSFADSLCYTENPQRNGNK